ncbi:hypothetical protein K4H28_04695 [Deefgea tanakiae]|uniref:Uncharacterized protein n=1 Tax=Deefgea tanakiae TaxID=2865840 RepID=A0ABX8ZC39_9NEIS|nr:hypothetical protein [Deefgea tanakiae]QZA78713.1 hypothetical protein K4H28_04695 [Deefgea tanakiae]
MDKFLEVYISRWREPVFGYFVLPIMIFLIVAPIWSSIKISQSSWEHLGVAFLFSLGVIYFTFKANRLPSCKPGKLNFVVAISGKNEGNLIEDFFEEIKAQMKSSAVVKDVNFVLLNPYLSKKVIEMNPVVAREKLAAHYYIYGKLVNRKKAGNDVVVISLDGAVFHGRSLNSEDAQLFANEFRTVLPEKQQISINDSLSDLEFSAGNVVHGSKYILACASAMAGDYEFSYTLLCELKDTIRKSTSKQEIGLEYIRRVVNARIDEVLLAYSRALHGIWRETKDKETLTRAIEVLEDRKKHIGRYDYSYRIQKAIYLFSNERKIQNALREIDQARALNISCSLWRFSRAFLLAYSGRHEEALNEYLNLSKSDYEPITLFEVQEFIEWVIQEEPDKKYFYYYLGLINQLLVGDNELAAQDYIKAIEHGLPDPLIKNWKKNGLNQEAIAV